MISDFYFSNFQDKKDKEILSNPDVKQRVLMMTDETKDKKLELTKEQQKQIARHFAVMFYALVTVHWCGGVCLGSAQQKALEQMSSFVKSKSDPEHPMNKYLHALNNQYHREIPERIMFGKYSGCKIDLDSGLTKKWAGLATNRFQKSLKFINDMYKEYTPENITVTQTSQNTTATETLYEKMRKTLQTPNDGYQRAA